jgi:ribosomal protein S18 acetylase RimI-like enzyme
MIKYIYSTESLVPDQLEGFFVGWENRPSKKTHLRLLQQSDNIILAMENDIVVGFITAISDSVLSAYIPFLEVLPAYKQQGIGKELLKRMLEQLQEYYMIDTICDPDMEKFYSRFGMHKANGMVIRNYDKQNASLSTL